MRAVIGRPGTGRGVLEPAQVEAPDDCASSGVARQGIPVVPQLRVKCWCERRYVVVATADVRAGRTGSCGGTGCEP